MVWENTVFVGILLSAKFNRFFIILGGGGQTDQKSQFLVVLGVWRGPIYWDFGVKIAKIPDTSSAFFVDFSPSDIRGIGPHIREISEKHVF